MPHHVAQAHSATTQVTRRHITHPHLPRVSHYSNYTLILCHSLSCINRLRRARSSNASTRPRRLTRLLQPLQQLPNVTNTRGRPKKRRRGGGRRKANVRAGPPTRVVLSPVSVVMKQRIKNLTFVNPSPSFVPRWVPARPLFPCTIVHSCVQHACVCTCTSCHSPLTHICTCTHTCTHAMYTDLAGTCGDGEAKLWSMACRSVARPTNMCQRRNSKKGMQPGDVMFLCVGDVYNVLLAHLHHSVVVVNQKWLMAHAYHRHVLLAMYVVFYCVRIVSGMCTITGRGVYRLTVSLCDDVKRGRKKGVSSDFFYIFIYYNIIYVIYTYRHDVYYIFIILVSLTVVHCFLFHFKIIVDRCLKRYYKHHITYI